MLLLLGVGHFTIVGQTSILLLFLQQLMKFALKHLDWHIGMNLKQRHTILYLQHLACYLEIIGLFGLPRLVKYMFLKVVKTNIKPLVTIGLTMQTK